MTNDIEKLVESVKFVPTGDVQRDTRRLLRQDIAVLQGNVSPELDIPNNFLRLCAKIGVGLDISLAWRDEKIAETFGHLEALDYCVYEGEHAFPIEG